MLVRNDEFTGGVDGDESETPRCEITADVVLGPVGFADFGSVAITPSVMIDEDELSALLL